MGTGDGTMESGVDVMIGMTATVQALNSSLDVNFVMDLLDSETSSVIDGISYKITKTDGLGTWLTITEA